MKEADHQALLERIYLHHDRWLATLRLACGPGCASCCTQSVTMTSLEGARLLDFLRRAGRENELAALPWTEGAAGKVPLTTNGFAAACLRGEEPEEAEAAAQWDFTPCPFLRGQRCSVYPARPFACRAFVSQQNCAATGSAQVAPQTVTVNTVFLQLVEHLGQGGQWGKMAAVLAWLRRESQGTAELGAENMTDTPKMELGASLRVAEPLPGLLIPPGEEMAVNAILGPLLRDTIQGRSVAELLGLA